MNFNLGLCVAAGLHEICAKVLVSNNYLGQTTTRYLIYLSELYEDIMNV